MVACCQRLRGHRTVSKVRASVLRTRNCQKTRPKLSYRIASSKQFSLQVPLKRWKRWWRGHRGRQTVPYPSRRHRKSAIADVGEAGEGTASASEEDDRRRRRVSRSATRWRSWQGSVVPDRWGSGTPALPVWTRPFDQPWASEDRIVMASRARTSPLDWPAVDYVTA